MPVAATNINALKMSLLIYLLVINTVTAMAGDNNFLSGLVRHMGLGKVD